MRIPERRKIGGLNLLDKLQKLSDAGIGLRIVDIVLMTFNVSASAAK